MSIIVGCDLGQHKMEPTATWALPHNAEQALMSPNSPQAKSTIIQAHFYLCLSADSQREQRTGRGGFVCLGTALRSS